MLQKERPGVTEMEKLKEVYKEISQDYWVRKGEKEQLEAMLTAKKKDIALMEDQIYLYRQVSKVYQMAAEYARNRSKTAVENIVSRALRIVFPGDLSFAIEMEEKGDRAEANFLVTSTYGGDQIVSNEPQEARGGGVVDVIALALRIGLLETAGLPKNGPLVLDEPAKHVSQEYSRHVAEFLNMVVQTFNRQIIMVTHNQYLADAGGKAYEVHIENGESIVTAR